MSDSSPYLAYNCSYFLFIFRDVQEPGWTVQYRLLSYDPTPQTKRDIAIMRYYSSREH